MVSEQHLLDLEREAFLSLLAERKTQERIQHSRTGKPLQLASGWWLGVGVDDYRSRPPPRGAGAWDSGAFGMDETGRGRPGEAVSRDHVFARR
jgi:hypothetical protein